MTTRPVQTVTPMADMMIQAFLRDLTGRFDISDVEVYETRDGQMLVRDPEGENVLWPPQHEGRA